MCIVDLDAPPGCIAIDVSYGQAGQAITIVKMRKAISGMVYYAIEGGRMPALRTNRHPV
jgi:hypothetical protein